MGKPLVRPDPDPESAIYPDSDGLPMADNTEQFAFIQSFQGNLDLVRPDFVAGDHLWYPVRGEPQTRLAPDVYVAVGRPKGHRGSYRQWQEDNVPLTVVFEWWSPGNGPAEQARKLQFYEQHGVTEFYTFDETRRVLAAFWRKGDHLAPQPVGAGITSPLLGIRLQVVDRELRAWLPDGRPFLTLRDLDQARRDAELARDQAEWAREQAERDREQAERDREQAERDRERAERAQEQAEGARRRAEQDRDHATEERALIEARVRELEARLRGLGLDP